VKITFGRYLLAAVLSGCVGLAVAGTKTHTATVINDTFQYAQGSLSSARSSSDTLQFIYCELYAAGNIQCRARDSAGNLRTCSTSDPNYVKAVQMINISSFVFFSWDAAGNCTNLLVRNGSNYLP
jgi:hypothetical protein